MAVYTPVSLTEARALFNRLQLGELRALDGILGGIENTNYFATSDQGDYVLTLFERLTHEQLPFYLELMRHLAAHGVPVPVPVADPRSKTGCALLHTLNRKPAAVVSRLPGRSELAPTPAHCATVGAMLARVHRVGQSFALRQPNLRSLPWWNDTAPLVLPHLNAAQRQLLLTELALQNHVAQSADWAALRRGPVHADLFRDNAMFNGSELTGFFDFYFAGVDSWLFDLAVCLNDWCIDQATGAWHDPRLAAFTAHYLAANPLTAPERRLLPAMTRAAALRFWLSRLWDFHLPRDAKMLTAHDPRHFERVLTQRATAPLTATALDRLIARQPAARATATAEEPVPCA